MPELTKSVQPVENSAVLRTNWQPGDVPVGTFTTDGEHVTSSYHQPKAARPFTVSTRCHKGQVVGLASSRGICL